MNNKFHKTSGFTLIELMIVVAIIGILAGVALPKFAEMVRKSREAATRGNLGAIRSAICIYYSDNEGSYPDTLETLAIGGRYIKEIPYAWTDEFGSVNNVTNGF